MPISFWWDDTPELLALVSRALAGAGYTRLRTAGSCAAARRAFAARVPELVVLDINLPDGDGFSLFRELNAGRARVPVLFLSARDADADRLFGLGLGGGRLSDQNRSSRRSFCCASSSSCAALTAARCSRAPRPRLTLGARSVDPERRRRLRPGRAAR